MEFRADKHVSNYPKFEINFLRKRKFVPNTNTNLGYGPVWDKNEIKSEVENTLTLDCFLNDFSSDQIGALEERAKAKYGSSLWTPMPCGDIFTASDRESSYFSAGYIPIVFLSK